MHIDANRSLSSQSPYIVGRWVHRHEHYARQALITHLLTASDNAFWLVGARRMGKTSVLRQIEYLTTGRESAWIPLFWDLQGCVTPEDAAIELNLALEDCAARFDVLGIDVTGFAGRDAVTTLRTLTRQIADSPKKILILIDEGEVLVEIAAQDPAWLARLRKALQEGNVRTILASTQYLTRLNAARLDWVTSPFLFGFRQLSIQPFDVDGAVNLVRQTQSGFQISVADDVLADILRQTNQHPYLIQYLCHRLYVPVGPRAGYLRSIEAGDLEVDHLLDAYFRIDIEQMDELDRRLLSIASENSTITQEQLVAMVGPDDAPLLLRHLKTLNELGHLSKVGDNWMLGNEFLRRWLFECRAELRPVDMPSAQSPRLREDNITVLATDLGVPMPHPTLSPASAITTELDFCATVIQLMGEVRRLIEQDDGHKLLVNALGGGKLLLRSEEEVQIALKHFLRPLCEPLDIDLNREPLTGRGYLDFKFSIGHRFRCLMEVKLFNSSKLEDGVGIQLPLYMLAEKAKYGIYVPVFLEDSGYAAAVRQLQAIAADRMATHCMEIHVMDVRTWKPKSASKADEVEMLSRYSLARP